MVSAILVVHLNRLHMREFQLWVASCGLDPMHHGTRRVLVTPGCPVLSNTQGADGLCPVQEGGHYRCQPDGLGRNSQGPVCEGPLECGPPVVSHKFSGTVSCVPSISHGPSCPGEDRQYEDGGIHQPSRGVMLLSVVHAGMHTDPVVLQSSPLTERSLRREYMQCTLFYSLRSMDASLGVDALAHAWLHELLYVFPSLTLIPPTLSRVRGHGQHWFW